MFSLSFWEVFFVASIAIMVLKPEDVPVIAKKIGQFVRQVKSYFSDLTNILDESGEVKVKKIIADDGLEYEAYEVDEVFQDLETVKKNKASVTKKVTKKKTPTKNASKNKPTRKNKPTKKADGSKKQK